MRTCNFTPSGRYRRITQLISVCRNVLQDRERSLRSKIHDAGGSAAERPCGLRWHKTSRSTRGTNSLPWSGATKIVNAMFDKPRSSLCVTSSLRPLAFAFSVGCLALSLAAISRTGAFAQSPPAAARCDGARATAQAGLTDRCANRGRAQFAEGDGRRYRKTAADPGAPAGCRGSCATGRHRQEIRFLPTTPITPWSWKISSW